MNIVILLFVLISGCVFSPLTQERMLLQGEVLIETDTLWQGDVVIDGVVTVAHGATLNIAPGSVVRFVRRDTDRDGLGDATIIVKGSLVAQGTEDQQIHFISAEADPQPADWLEIRSDFAQQLSFDWCEFRDSAYTLHAHFTRGHMRNSHIHHNIDGCRLGRSRFLFQHNLVEHNSGKGINFRDSEVTLSDNILRHNRVGIFLFEKPGQSVITGNDIYQNETNLQLGDFFTENISLTGNWWGDADPHRVDATIQDKLDDPELGRVSTSPAASWLFTAGIQHSAELRPLWQFKTGGFIDATPIQLDDRIVLSSWDGFIRALDADGKLLWQTDTGDVVDGGLLALDGEIYLQNWSRQFYQIEQHDGRKRLLFSYPSSLADDHRQAGLAATADLILLPAWNGTLYAFERTSQKIRWTFNAGMPLRALPVVTQDRIYQVSGNNSLSVLGHAGQVLWQKSFEASLLAAPALADENVIVLDKSGKLTYLDASGRMLWQKKLGQECFYSAPLVIDDAVFVATAAGTLWKLNLHDGAEIWSKTLAGSVYASPVHSAAGLILGDNNGNLYLIDSDSGRMLAKYKVEDAIQSQVLVTGNRLYFGSRDQNLHALQLFRIGSLN